MYQRFLSSIALILCQQLLASNMTVTLQYAGAQPSMVVQVNSVTPPHNSQVYAGAYLNYVSFSSGSNAAPLFGTITQPVQMFCIDIAGPTGSGYVYDTTLVPVTNAPVQSGYSGGAAGYPMSPTRASWLGVMTSNYWNTGYLTSDLQYAALQVAIWEIVFEGNTTNDIPTQWDVNSGDFTITGDAIAAEANNILTGTTSLVTNYGLVNLPQQPLGALVSLDYQDMLVKTIPEPSSLLLLAGTVLWLLIRRPRRKENCSDPTCCC